MIKANYAGVTTSRLPYEIAVTFRWSKTFTHLNGAYIAELWNGLALYVFYESYKIPLSRLLLVHASFFSLHKGGPCRIFFITLFSCIISYITPFH